LPGASGWCKITKKTAVPAACALPAVSFEVWLEVTAMPYYRRNLLTLCVAVFLASSAWQQVVPFLPLFLQDLGVKEGLNQWSGVVYALHYISAIFFLPFWGKLADRYGRKPLVLRAGICLSLLYFAMSFARSPYHVAVVRFLNGALTGFIPGATALVATNTPRELTGRYVAAIQTASAGGTIIGPAIGGALADLFGFRGALQASGLMVFTAVLLVLVFVVEHNKTVIASPTTIRQDVQTAFSHPVLFGTMLAMGFTAFATLSLQPVLTLYLTELSGEAANWLRGAIFSLPGVAFMLTASLWTRWGERAGFEPLMPLGLLLSGVLAAILAWPRSIYGFAFLYFVMGICVAALRPAAAALVALKVEEGFQGRAYALQQSAFMFGGFAGPLLTGAVGELLGTRWTFVWLGLFLVASALFMHRLVQSWKRQAKVQLSGAVTKI